MNGTRNEACIDEFTEQDWKKFEDPEIYKKFRHDLEQEMNVSFHLCFILVRKLIAILLLLDSPYMLLRPKDPKCRNSSSSLSERICSRN